MGTDRSRELAARAALCLLLLLSALSGCVGTPTPEPPDTLATPRGSLIGADAPEFSPQTDPAPLYLAGRPGAVAPKTDVWVLNLDDAKVAPTSVLSLADGSFTVRTLAQPGDRVRVLSRSELSHSAPLDLEVIERTLGVLDVRALADESLACLRVSPALELQLSEDDARFVLTNECTFELSVERAELRLQDRGFRLVSAPGRLLAGASAGVVVGFAGTPERELTDVLLLELATPDGLARYALSLWAK